MDIAHSLALLLLAAPAQPGVAHHYAVRVDPALSEMHVRACFADGLPDRLVASHPLAARATGGFRVLEDGETRHLAVRGQVVYFPRPSDDGCVEWRTDLDVIAEVHRMNIGWRSANSLVLATGTWFWRPPVLTRNRELEFSFELPPGFAVSAPWIPLDSSEFRFRHDHTPLDWPALIAVGELRQSEFLAGAASLRLAVTSGPGEVDTHAVTRWLRSGAKATSMLWNDFPVESLQLLVVPVTGGYDAAPWAQTSRGGGPGAHFFMNTKANEEVFAKDWIATHELVHFALPHVRRRDAWLPEGFASYYQHILRARAGMITEEEAWQALHEGILRGNRNAGHDTLRDDTLYMHSRGRAMRVYWSGAAIAMLADIQLRRQSGGEWSLDRVLREFHDCCRKPERTWSARELFAEFDRISGGDHFDRLYARHVYSRHFPRTEEAWQSIGIRTNGERVFIDEEAEGSWIREAIARPPVTADAMKR